MDCRGRRAYRNGPNKDHGMLEFATAVVLGMILAVVMGRIEELNP
jgi:hypothetical protein